MSKQTDFIGAIAPLAQAEKQNRARWVLPSVCIAQAALESGWNVKARTLFGIKGRGANLKTVEYINGKYVNTTASFKAYPNLAAAVHGYYDLITGSSRYAGAVNQSDALAAITAIKNGGYATDPSYVSKIMSIINQYNLRQFDYVPTYNLDDIARKVIRGEFGNGQDRVNRLRNAGYDANAVQKRVNEMLKG